MTTTVQIIDICKTAGQKFLIDGVPVEIEWSREEVDLLRIFVDDLRFALVSNNIDLLRNLQTRCDSKQQKSMYMLFSTVLEEEFIAFYVSCGLDFLGKGQSYSKSAFIKYIRPSESKRNELGEPMGALLCKSRESFLKAVVLYMRAAFERFDTLSVCRHMKSLGGSLFFQLVVGELSNDFSDYLKKCAQIMIQNHQEISWRSLWKAAFSTDPNYQASSRTEGYKEFFLSEVTRWREEQTNQNLRARADLSHDVWSLPYHDVDAIRTTALDFRSIEPQLKNEIKSYLRFYYEKGEKPRGLARRYRHLLRISMKLQTIVPAGTSVLQVSYVEVLRLLEAMQQAKKTDGRSQYALKTVQISISEARMLFDWLKQREQIVNVKNPFRRLKLYNVNSFVESADYIPDDVVEKIKHVIHECPPHVYRAWIIMMNTGMRISEVLNLEEDCLEYRSQENTYYLRFIPSKTIKHRRRLGLEDYHAVPLMNEQLVDCIREQIASTEDLRRKGNTPYIFVRLSKNNRRIDPNQQRVSRHLGSTISQSINLCIKRHNICDHGGQLWQYSHHQCRKTLAVKLLSAGGAIAEVGEVLGHLVEKTTRQYYQDVDAKKISELDRKLFEQLFDTIDDEIRQAFTPIELEELKKEILIGSRETPEGHGSCLKHVSFGPCKKRSCVGCSLLLTGPQKLPMWRKLRDEQKQYLEDTKKAMTAQGIEEYEEFRDYQSELHLLGLYESTITKIERFLKDRR